MRQDRFRRWFLLAILLLGLLPQSDVSGFMPNIPLERLWNESEVAVLGNVTNIQPSKSGGFYTIVEIKVEESFKQQIDKTTVKIRIEGGERNGIEYWAEDQPEFEVDEYVFVFLHSPDKIRDYEYVVFGMFQGKYSVKGTTAFQETGRTFEIPFVIKPKIVGGTHYEGIGFQQLIIVGFLVVLLSIFIVWLLTPN